MTVSTTVRHFFENSSQTKKPYRLESFRSSLWNNSRLRSRGYSSSSGLYFHFPCFIFRKYLSSCGHLQEKAATKIHQLLRFQHGCIRPLQPFDHHDCEDRWDHFRIEFLESWSSVAARKHSMQTCLLSARCFRRGFHRKPSFDLYHYISVFLLHSWSAVNPCICFISSENYCNGLRQCFHCNCLISGLQDYQMQTMKCSYVDSSLQTHSSSVHIIS